MTLRIGSRALCVGEEIGSLEQNLILPANVGILGHLLGICHVEQLSGVADGVYFRSRHANLLWFAMESAPQRLRCASLPHVVNDVVGRRRCGGACSAPMD
jgi:hypothetical protein